jgi:hypothetical protein
MAHYRAYLVGRDSNFIKAVDLDCVRVLSRLAYPTHATTHLHQIDALAGVNLGLAVQRQMVGIFEHNLAVCDPWRLFLAARHALPPTEFYRFYFTVRIHQLFISYLISTLGKRFERKLRSPSRGKG